MKGSHDLFIKIGSQHLKNYLTQTNQSLSTTQNYKCAEELYKVHRGLAPEFMNDIFKKRNMTYNFRKNSTFETRNVKSCLLWLKNNIRSWQAQKYGKFCQTTLKIQKIVTSSNQILTLEA